VLALWTVELGTDKDSGSAMDFFALTNIYPKPLWDELDLFAVSPDRRDLSSVSPDRRDLFAVSPDLRDLSRYSNPPVLITSSGGLSKIAMPASPVGNKVIRGLPSH
jgi:hypothetical protein